MTVAPSAVTTQLASLDFGSLWSLDQLKDSLGSYLLVGLCLIVFAECGLLIGFFLPGDILLFPAGVFCQRGTIDTPFWLVCVYFAGSAFLGNVVGYWIGRSAGPSLFNKPDSKIFKRQNVEKTQEFFDRYGSRAVIIGRFVPVVRTFITAMAGVAKMNAPKYFMHSFIGGVIWAAGVPALGYFLGKQPFVKDHFEMVIVTIAVLSAVPIYIEMARQSNEKERKEKEESARRAAQRY